jgi:hypothetical protein
MPLLGSSGFDIYQEVDGKSIFLSRFMPEANVTGGYEMRIRFENTDIKNLTIYFPLYNQVDSVYIGVGQDSLLGEGASYKHKKPVVYYGSSITQGGCASRTGNAYEAIISRMCDTDYMCLGFSGSALGESDMAEYIANMDMSIFVMDYDYNAPTAEHLEKTHEDFFKIVRDKQPDLPVVFVTKPNFSDYSFDNVQRRNIIYKTYMNAMQKGDRNVYFIDGRSLFQDDYRECCTVDGVHPNDFGFVRMAQTIGRIVKELL